MLLALAKEKTIPSLTEALRSDTFQSLCYYHEGSFSPEKLIADMTNSDEVITIHTQALSYQLLLDCSLRFFSAGNEPDGNFHISSDTSSFFRHGYSLEFSTVFMLLSLKEKNIVGTPLFLKLEVPDDLEWDSYRYHPESCVKGK